jgi:protocatechuate 3,4-dioxygenase beta subunit
MPIRLTTFHGILFTSFFAFAIATSCSGQQPPPSDEVKVGGPCEGCEAVYEYGSQKLSHEAVLPGYDTAQQKLRLEGTVFRPDGKTPAADVILYVYHTNAVGVYAPGPEPKGWERRHGMHRGWVKTGEDGKYTVYTQLPAPYPGRSEPAHIHLTVKEPGMSPYWIESVHFDDDPLLDYRQRNRLTSRGGPGIVVPEKSGRIRHAIRDIHLGREIPGYPK